MSQRSFQNLCGKCYLSDLPHSQTGVLIQQVLKLHLPALPPKLTLKPCIFKLNERSEIKDSICLWATVVRMAHIPPLEMIAG